MGYLPRSDTWDGLTVNPSQGKFEWLEKEYAVDITSYKIPYDPEGEVRIAFIYESDEEDLPKIVSRVVKRAVLQHSVKSLEYVHLIKVTDHEKYFDILTSQLLDIDPDVVICTSRDVMRKLNPPKRFTGVDPLQLINRLHVLNWGGELYNTVITMPDDEVLRRTDDGKIAKEAATRLGEWVYAFVTALRMKNLYTIDLKNYNYHIVDTIKKFDKFMDLLYKQDVVSIDTETDNLNRIMNRLGTVQFAFTKDEAWIVPINHPGSPFTSTEVEYILGELRDYFETGETAEHVFANAKFDILQLRRECKFKWYNHTIWDCFHPDTYVMTNRGKMKISDIVSSKDRPLILSYNHSKKQTEFKPVENAWRKPSNKPMVELEYEGGKVLVTYDELIWCVNKNRYVKAGNLSEDDEILGA